MQLPLPRDTARISPPAPPIATRDTIRPGDAVVAVLVRDGLAPDDARAALKASEMRGTARREIPVALYADSASAPIREVEFQVADDRSLRVVRESDLVWVSTERREIWRTDTVVVRAPTTGSLVESLRLAGRGTLAIRSRLEAAYAIAEAFEYKLDVGRDLVKGDSVLAVIERRRTAFGTEQVGQLVAGGLFHDGQWMRVIRFTASRGKPEYYDPDGHPMRTTFLSAPVEFRRMSSGFGMRVHPLLGTLRRHAGIDFTAPLGTPVRAVGDGAVISAGWAGGFGKLIEIRHRDGMVTRYGHLRAFAPTLREGQVVEQGDVVGFVGSTGLSTGPHLHFETIVNGVSREPSRALRAASGVSLTGSALASFGVVRATLASRLGIASGARGASPGLRVGPTTAPAAAAQSSGASVGTPK